jgi:hypothetical protein
MRRNAVAEEKQDSLFVDTSIEIARVVHGPLMKARIRERLARHRQTVTSLVVRQEFKRRLLKEAEYLLRQLHRYKSFDEVLQHVIRLPGQWPGRVRKRNICLQTLSQLHAGGTDRERAERAQLYLRSLLVSGLKRFDQRADVVRGDSACACARAAVVEKVPLRKYDMGPEHCSRLKPGACGVADFLAKRAEVREQILRHLRGLPDDRKSLELKNAEAFLVRMAKSPARAAQEDPCLKIGDLLIALESAGVQHFFTLNRAESQHLCRALGQTLIVRPVDPLKPDVVCSKEDATWPEFGKRTGTSSAGLGGEGEEG